MQADEHLYVICSHMSSCWTEINCILPLSQLRVLKMLAVAYVLYCITTTTILLDINIFNKNEYQFEKYTGKLPEKLMSVTEVVATCRISLQIMQN